MTSGPSLREVKINGVRKIITRINPWWSIGWVFTLHPHLLTNTSAQEDSLKKLMVMAGEIIATNRDTKAELERQGDVLDNFI